jgi:hypothetical protein
MRLFQEGNWSTAGAHDEIAADVMKFVGRDDFAPTLTHGASTPNKYAGISLTDNVHPVLFEYMKRFEKQPERNSALASTSLLQPSANFRLPTQQISPIIPTLASNFNSCISNPAGIPLESANNSSALSQPSPTFTLTQGTLDSVTSLSGDITTEQISMTNPSQPYLSSGLAHGLLHGSPFLTQIVDPFDTDQQPVQHQVWEQFLYALMSPETSPDSTST